MTDKYTPKITITNFDDRGIDNLRITVWFQINGQTYFDYEDRGTFKNIQTDGLTGVGGTWNGSQWVGNLLHKTGSPQSVQQATNSIEKVLAETNSPFDVDYVNDGYPVMPNIQILKDDNENRDITQLNLNVEFSIGGEYYTDSIFLGDFVDVVGLAFTGMGGTKGSNGWWTGNFLTLQYHGVDTTINPTLLTFLNVLFIICLAANAAAAVAGTADEIRRGFDGGAPGQGGWSLGQQI